MVVEDGVRFFSFVDRLASFKQQGEQSSKKSPGASSLSTRGASKSVQVESEQSEGVRPACNASSCLS